MMELDLPTAPNWLIWFGLLASVILFLDWSWRRYLADWWASLSQDRARTRAIRLFEIAYEVGKARGNISRLIVNATLALFYLISGGLFLLIAFIAASTARVEFLIKHLSTTGDLAATSEWPYRLQWLLEAWPVFIGMIFGLLCFLRFQWIFRNRIQPQSDHKKYIDRVKAQTKALLKKAGIPESEWVAFLKENWPKTDDTKSRGDG